MISEIVVKMQTDTGSIERRFFGRWDETNYEHIKDMVSDIEDFVIDLYLKDDPED